MNRIILPLIGILLMEACDKNENQVSEDQTSEPTEELEPREPKEFPTEVNGSLEFQGNTREYKLHVPPSYDATSEVPLVIVLHGGGGTATNIQNFTQMNPVSDSEGFIVAYPQGLGPTGEGYSWADGRGSSANTLGIDDVGFIDTLTAALVSEYEIDSEKLYICGFSNGGFMTQKLACESDTRFAAMASLGSTISAEQLNECTPNRSIPMLFIFGDADPLVPYDGGTVAENPAPVAGIEAAVAFWKTNNNCQTETELTDLPDLVTDDNSTAQVQTFSNCDCEANVKFFKLVNGGHTWPGVERAFLEPTLGETNEDIMASEELWNFFSQYEFCE